MSTSNDESKGSADLNSEESASVNGSEGGTGPSEVRSLGKRSAAGKENGAKITKGRKKQQLRGKKGSNGTVGEDGENEEEEEDASVKDEDDDNEENEEDLDLVDEDDDPDYVPDVEKEGEEALPKEQRKRGRPKNGQKKATDCPICGKEFSHIWALREHVRVHTGKSFPSWS